jgi:multidrug resistance efflux pump
LSRSARSPRYALASASLVLALLGCAACDASTPTVSGHVEGGLVVRRGTFRQTALLTGDLKAVRAERIVVPRTPAWQLPIRWMEADGVSVEAGQKILELDNTQFSGELEQKRLAESKALNELIRKEADLAVELADRQFQFDTAAIRLEKARLEAEIPEQVRSRREHQEKQLALARAQVEHEKAVEELEASRRAADAELEELRIALERARKEIRIAEEAIRALTLEAPREGILVVAEHPREGRKLQIGDTVWVGLAVMSIPELSAMKVEARLSDVDDGRVEVGMPARCTLDTYPDLVFTGTVHEITPIAKEQGTESLRRAFSVVVLLDTADPERMRPGMSVKVEVLGPETGNALLVPRAALDLGGENPRALLADGSAVEVRLGSCEAMFCVVEEGLEEGARLRARG